MTSTLKVNLLNKTVKSLIIKLFEFFYLKSLHILTLNPSPKQNKNRILNDLYNLMYGKIYFMTFLHVHNQCL